MKRFIPSRFQSRPASLWKLPLKIIKSILLYLSTPDFICVLLTCKSFFGPKIRGKRLAQLIPPEEREMLCPNWKLERKPRIQLLLQLENRRWRYCSECWSLHPRSEWRIPRSLMLFPKRYDHPPFGVRRGCCVPFAGEVDICPCLTITLLDKIRLLETINLARQRDPSTQQYYYNKALHHPISGRRRNPVGHECVILSHPLIKLNIDTSLWVDEDTQGLCVSNSYLFERLEHSHTGVTVIPFPQTGKEVGKWLTSFLAEAGSSFFNHEHDPQHFEIVKPMEDPKCFAIRSMRNLGKRKWPDRDWTNNCRH